MNNGIEIVFQQEQNKCLVKANHQVAKRILPRKKKTMKLFILQDDPDVCQARKDVIKNVRNSKETHAYP